MLPLLLHIFQHVCDYTSFHVEVYTTREVIQRTSRKNASQVHNFEKKTKKNVQKTSVLINQICVSGFSSFTVEGQSRNFGLKKVTHFKYRIFNF